MPDSLRKALQAAGIWSAILLILEATWPSALNLPQLWMVFLVSVLANALQPAYSPFEGSRTAEDRGTMAQLVWTVYLSQVAALVELIWRKRLALPLDFITWMAFSAMLGGLALRTWAVILLGPWFTLHITVQPGQALVTHGPYRLIRHPSYTGLMIIFITSCVLLRSWIVAGLAVVAFTLASSRRIRYEEALLTKTFPEYPVYAARTGKLFPRFFVRDE